ncbi:MAG TPA: PAS domain S-box protein, partial [Salinibacter sp.]|nr:PAS domain S-box protein [Salinibacter sp.]
MSRSVFKSLFRPRDDGLSDRERSQVQIYRLLFLLGTLLCLLFIPLFEVSSPNAVDPIWMRIAVSGLLLGVFAASYGSTWVRHNFAAWVRGTIYVIIGWFIFISALNGFASDYEIGLLLLHAIFTVIAGLGARSIRPLMGFTLTSLFAATGAVVLSSASMAGEAVLLGGMATISLVVAIVVQRLILTRERLQDQESRLRGLANSIPGVVFQFYAHYDGTRGTYFVSEHAEEVLGIAATPERFYERVMEGIPTPYREDAIASIEEAIANRAPWRYEIPYETPSGERIWLLGASAPQEKGDEIVYNGVLLDVTERKEAKEELQKTKNWYQTLVENFPS